MHKVLRVEPSICETNRKHTQTAYTGTAVKQLRTNSMHKQFPQVVSSLNMNRQQQGANWEALSQATLDPEVKIPLILYIENVIIIKCS